MAEENGSPRHAFLYLLDMMVKRRASDLFFKVGTRPSMRISGRVGYLKTEPVTPELMDAVVAKIMDERHRKTLEAEGEVDLAYEAEGIGRFRVNVFRQRGQLSAVFRYVPKQIPTFEELNLPTAQLKKLSSQSRGLVLLTGVTGSGKSTTLAVMIDYINRHFNKHVVTIEDPIEFLHEDNRSIIDQREIGLDTRGFGNALKHIVRQSPDVILIGEMRDEETISAALNAAEIGHLVFSTLHTASAIQTLERIVSFFPPYQHSLLRQQLAMTIQGIISQRLIVRADGEGRVPAVELLMRSPTAVDVLLKGAPGDLQPVMRDDEYFGSQTYHQALKKLHDDKVITLEEALAYADNPQELLNEIKGLVVGRSYQTKPNIDLKLT